MTVLHCDFESFSPLDLKAVGVENYVRSPGFAVTVFAWAFDDGPVQSVVWPNTQLPPGVRKHLAAGGEFRAWNAAFEWNIFNLHYNISPTHEQANCTMQRALAYGLPGKLETAGPAMGLAIVKDATARRLMLSMGKASALDERSLSTGRINPTMARANKTEMDVMSSDSARNCVISCL